MLINNFTRKICKTICSRSFHNRIGVIGVPFNKGQPKNGVDRAPTVLREAGLLHDIAALGKNTDVKDYGDIKYEISKNENVDNMKNWAHVTECMRCLSSEVAKVIKDNRICLTIGGDHSIGLGTVQGHASVCEPGKIAVLWVDAHADINTNKSSQSGNIHGMPMALLAKELRDEWPELPLFDWQKPLVSLNQLAYIGLRSVDNFERFVIDKYKITAFDMKEIENYGINNVIKMALQKIDPDRNCSLHVSFDIDSLDVFEAPSTGTPVRGGLTLREGIEIMETIAETGRLKAIDLVEVNPLIGNNKDVELTIQAAREIILAAFGNNRRGLK